MATQTISERIFFTFRSNGIANDTELVEATAEKLDEHEPPVGTAAAKQSWFGAQDDLGSMLESISFTVLDIEGVLSTLKVNKIATRELELDPSTLSAAGFTPTR